MEVDLDTQELLKERDRTRETERLFRGTPAEQRTEEPTLPARDLPKRGMETLEAAASVAEGVGEAISPKEDYEEMIEGSAMMASDPLSMTGLKGAAKMASGALGTMVPFSSKIRKAGQKAGKYLDDIAEETSAPIARETTDIDIPRRS